MLFRVINFTFCVGSLMLFLVVNFIFNVAHLFRIARVLSSCDHIHYSRINLFFFLIYWHATTFIDLFQSIVINFTLIYSTLFYIIRLIYSILPEWRAILLLNSGLFYSIHLTCDTFHLFIGPDSCQVSIYSNLHSTPISIIYSVFICTMFNFIYLFYLFYRSSPFYPYLLILFYASDARFYFPTFLPILFYLFDTRHFLFI